MPTYEYACAACGHQWEQVQRIVEAPVEVCPECAQSSAHRLISGGTNFILKGGGWYSDLYSSAKAPAKAAESGSGGTAAASGSEGGGAKSDSGTKAESSTKTEAKPASPSPSTTPSTPSTSSSS
jgi:putative FmdB family regulatory protein